MFKSLSGLSNMMDFLCRVVTDTHAVHAQLGGREEVFCGIGTSASI